MSPEIALTAEEVKYNHLEPFPTHISELIAIISMFISFVRNHVLSRRLENLVDMVLQSSCRNDIKAIIYQKHNINCGISTLDVCQIKLSRQQTLSVHPIGRNNYVLV